MSLLWVTTPNPVEVDSGIYVEVQAATCPAGSGQYDFKFDRYRASVVGSTPTLDSGASDGGTSGWLTTLGANYSWTDTVVDDRPYKDGSNRVYFHRYLASCRNHDLTGATFTSAFAPATGGIAWGPPNPNPPAQNIPRLIGPNTVRATAFKESLGTTGCPTCSVYTSPYETRIPVWYQFAEGLKTNTDTNSWGTSEWQPDSPTFNFSNLPYNTDVCFLARASDDGGDVRETTAWSSASSFPDYMNGAVLTTSGPGGSICVRTGSDSSAPGAPRALDGTGAYSGNFARGSLVAGDDYLRPWYTAGFSRYGDADVAAYLSSFTPVTYTCAGTNDAPGLASFINVTHATDITLLLVNLVGPCDFGATAAVINRQLANGAIAIKGSQHWPGQIGNPTGTVINCGQANCLRVVGATTGGGPFTLTGPPASGSTSLNTTSAHGFAHNDWVVIQETVSTPNSVPPTLWAGYGYYGGYGLGTTRPIGKRAIRQVDSTGTTLFTLPTIEPIWHSYGGTTSGWSAAPGVGGAAVQKLQPINPVSFIDLHFTNNQSTGICPTTPGNGNDAVDNRTYKTSYIAYINAPLGGYVWGNTFDASPYQAVRVNGSRSVTLARNIFNGHKVNPASCPTNLSYHERQILVDGGSELTVVQDNIAKNFTRHLVEVREYSTAIVAAYNYVDSVNPGCYSGSMGGAADKSAGGLVYINGGYATSVLIEGNDADKCKVVEIDNYNGFAGRDLVIYKNRSRVSASSLEDGTLSVKFLRGASGVMTTFFSHVLVAGNHIRGLWALDTGGTDCGVSTADGYGPGHNADFNCHARNTWIERNIFWDQSALAGALNRGMVAGMTYTSDLDCGTGTGYAGCGADPKAVARGTNRQRDYTGVADFSADTPIPSMYIGYDPAPWMCAQSLGATNSVPWTDGKRPLIGAWDDDSTGAGTYTKLTAQRLYEGLACAAP